MAHSRIKTAAFSALGILCATLVVMTGRSIASPWSQLPSQAVIVVVDDSCGHSKSLFEAAARAQPSLDTQEYWFVPLGYGTPFSMQVCEQTLARLDSWRTRTLPVSVQCMMLGADARSVFFSDGGLKLPALIIDGELVPLEETKHKLGEIRSVLTVAR